MTRLLIIGTGGLAREFTSHFSGQVEIAGYSGNHPGEHEAFRLPGAFHAADVTPATAGTDRAVVAIGSPAVKARVHAAFRSRGFTFPTLVHRSSVVSDGARLDEGVVVSPQCVVSPGVRLGALAYLNFCCGVGHDTVVGRFVQMNPGAQVGGSTLIGAGTLVGSGATILQGVRIGPRAIVGSGAVVFTRVAAGATVIGNPAKRLRSFECPRERSERR